ncbi:MAG: very short patch repair endonuclease [Bacteroidia bacterium]|nr:very short patch repair endonuclease [Bacteroidia bacterium]
MDRLSKAQRSANMQRIRSAHTRPELKVRKIAYALGYRYRLHDRRLPGRPDLVFRAQRKVIFVNGCFWHQHAGCRAGRLPKSNQAYWSAKLRRNVQRDAEVRARLTRMGWQYLDLWECEIADPNQITSKLLAFLDNPVREYGA